MNVIICLDDRNGMLFNRRRKSKDSVLTEKVLELVGDGKLFLTEYSAKLFPENANLQICENPAQEAGEGEFAFMEQAFSEIDKTEAFFLFFWNRHYPSDTKFTFDLETEGFALVSERDFVGSSHDKITLKEWTRK